MKYMVCVDSSPQAMAAFDFVTSVARPEQDFILVVAVAELVIFAQEKHELWA